MPSIIYATRTLQLFTYIMVFGPVGFRVLKVLFQRYSATLRSEPFAILIRAKQLSPTTRSRDPSTRCGSEPSVALNTIVVGWSR